MKIVSFSLMLIGMGAVLLSAQTRSPASSQPARPGKTLGAAIPEGATQVQPYIYRYTDTQGKHWMYRQTPFGVTKWEEKDTPKPASDSLEPIVVTDLGDSVRFSHKYPFGEQVWTRKKAELTDEDKAIIELSKQTRPTSGNTEEKR